MFFQEKAASKGCSAEAALFKVSPCLLFFFHEFFKKSEILRFRCRVPAIQLDGGRTYRKDRRLGGGGGGCVLFALVVTVQTQVLLVSWVSGCSRLPSRRPCSES